MQLIGLTFFFLQFWENKFESWDINSELREKKPELWELWWDFFFCQEIKSKNNSVSQFRPFCSQDRTVRSKLENKFKFKILTQNAEKKSHNCEEKSHNCDHSDSEITSKKKFNHIWLFSPNFEKNLNFQILTYNSEKKSLNPERLTRNSANKIIVRYKHKIARTKVRIVRSTFPPSNKKLKDIFETFYLTICTFCTFLISRNS